MSVKVTTYLYSCDDDFSIGEFEDSITESLAYRTNAQQVESLIQAGERLQAYRMGQTEKLDSDDYDGESAYHDELDELNDLNARIRMRKPVDESETEEDIKNMASENDSSTEPPEPPEAA